MDEKINIGGQERPIRLTLSDGINLQEEFKFENPGSWLYNRVMGLHLNDGGEGFSLLGRVALITAALFRAANPNQQKKLNRGVVSDWLGEAAAEERMKEITWAVAGCAYRTGWPTGEVVDIDGETGGWPELKAAFFARAAADTSDSKSQPSSAE